MEPATPAPLAIFWSSYSWVIPHATALVLAFLAMTAGMLVARYGKKNKAWLRVHRPLGYAAAALGITGLGLGIAMVARLGGPHLRVPHAFLGAFTLLLLAATPILGRTIFTAREGKQGIRKAHRWTGRATILLMLLTILSGLAQAGIIPVPGFPM